MTTVWTPQTLNPQRWNPGEGELKLVVLDSNIAMGKASIGAPLAADLSKNVIGGRDPKTFELIDSTFPAGLIVELGGMAYFAPTAPQVGQDVQYIATIRCRDANNQIGVFSISTIDFVPSVPFSISMPLAPIHTGGQLDQYCVVVGAKKAVQFAFRGLNLEANGFTFDQTLGRLYGKYTGVTTVPNLYLIQAWLVDAVSPGVDLGAPDATYANTWNWINP